MFRRTPEQLSFPKPETHGGVRPGAGRKPSGRPVGVPHQPRGKHRARHPVHVTMRARAGLPSFRGDKLVFRAVRGALAEGHKTAFRVVHFSVQSNHLHLIVEASDRDALSRGMQGLTIRMARAVNRVLSGKGSVFLDRYHAHELKTPRETRAALLYVLQNWAKHGPGGAYDPLSSASWFDGWTCPPTTEAPPSMVAAPRTWLITIGWRRHGLLRPGERPASLASAFCA
jgi:REP element-mobilizing transposase RayT